MTDDNKRSLIIAVCIVVALLSLWWIYHVATAPRESRSRFPSPTNPNRNPAKAKRGF